MLDFLLEGASSILAEIVSTSTYLFLVFNLFLYDVRKHRHPRQHTAHEQCRRVLQPAGYNAIHACRPPVEPEATSRVCGSLSAVYCCGPLLIVPGTYHINIMEGHS